MHDSNINQNRLGDLIHTIGEAKQSLNNWQDKRTEALIRLDAFAYDIQQIGEEKKRTQDHIHELKAEIHNQAKIYQSHVNELTDQMQLLKLDNENLRNEILDRTLSMEGLVKEIDNQRAIREQQIKLNQDKMVEFKNETEHKSLLQIEEFKVQNDFLNAKIVELARAKAEADMRAEKAEREIVQIRSHMLNVLEVNQAGYGDKLAEKVNAAAASSKGADSKTAGRAAQPKRTAAYISSTDSAIHATPAVELSMEEVRQLRSMETEPDSVEDYLKRFGY